jgi:uncharacterized protein (TIGR03437 family)
LAYSNSNFVYSPTGSVLAPLLYAGPRQINFQVPPAISGEAVPLQFQRADGKTSLSSMRVVSTAPGIFTVLASGTGPGAVLNQDGSLNFPNNPAARGSVIQIYATGAGPTTPALGPGEAAPASGNPLVLTQVQPAVTIDSKPAQVLFSGMAPGFVGVWQINAVVPPDAQTGQSVSLRVTAGNVSSNVVNIAVRP